MACSSNPQAVKIETKIITPPTGLLDRPVVLSWEKFCISRDIDKPTNGDLASYVRYLYEELDMYNKRVTAIEEFFHDSTERKN